MPNEGDKNCGPMSNYLKNIKAIYHSCPYKNFAPYFVLAAGAQRRTRSSAIKEEILSRASTLKYQQNGMDQSMLNIANGL